MKNIFVGAVVISPVIVWLFLEWFFPGVVGLATLGVASLWILWAIGDEFNHPISNGRHL